MNYIKMSPLAGLSGYGGGTSGLYQVGGGAAEQNFGDRALVGGGRNNGTYHDATDYFSISSIANASDFGNLTAARSQLSSCSNGSLAFFCGGYSGGNHNVIDYYTVANTGNATDYGDLSNSRRGGATAGSTTRGIHGGGDGYQNVMDYFDISTTSGSTTDFGNLTSGREGTSALSDLTRAVWAGGYDQQNVMDYVTIDSTGNATDFGDLTSGRSWPHGCTNLVRGLFCGGTGSASDNQTTAIDYITVQTAANAADFGDMISLPRKTAGTCSDGTKAVMCAGYNQTNNAYYDSIQYVTIDTLGNATDSGYSLSNTDRGYTTASSGD